MIVDDESFILDSFKDLLNRQGYKVVIFNESRKALERFVQDPDGFDLVITDMTMPQMTGDKFSGEILKIRDDIPIIICTGYNKRLTEEKAREIGIKKYLLKPVSFASLSDAIQELLDMEES